MIFYLTIKSFSVHKNKKSAQICVIRVICVPLIPLQPHINPPHIHTSPRRMQQHNRFTVKISQHFRLVHMKMAVPTENNINIARLLCKNSVVANAEMRETNHHIHAITRAEEGGVMVRHFDRVEKFHALVAA